MKTSIRYAKENDREKTERRRERDWEGGRDKWERERGERRRVNPTLRLILSPNYVSGSQADS